MDSAGFSQSQRAARFARAGFFEPAASCFFGTCIRFLFSEVFSFLKKKVLAKQARCHCATSPLKNEFRLFGVNKILKGRIVPRIRSFNQLEVI